MTHSKFLSPSGFGTWGYCFGAPAAQLLLPPLQNYEADEGTVAHHIARMCLEMDTDAEFFIERVFNSITVDHEIVRGVQKYLDLVRAIKPDQQWIETRMGAQSIHAELFGTPDFVAVKGRTLEVIDFKFGRVPVSPLGGQLLIYAILAIETKSLDIDQVVLTICQPRSTDSIPVKIESISARDLEYFRDEILTPTVKLVTSDRPPRLAGKHCKFCRAKMTCPEYREYTRGYLEPPFPSTTSELVVWLERLEGLDRLKTEVVAEATKRALAGEAIEGYKIVEKITRRAFTNEDDVVEALTALGATQEDLYKLKLKTPAQLEKIFGKPALEQLTFKPRGELVLAQMSDRRPARATAKEIFNGKV